MSLRFDDFALSSKPLPADAGISYLWGLQSTATPGSSPLTKLHSVGGMSRENYMGELQFYIPMNILFTNNS